MMRKKLPDLVIFVFTVYKVTETLLQTSTRLQIYHLACFCVTKTLSTDANSSCYHIGVENETADELTQTLAVPFLVGYRVLLNLPAMFVCLILGSWSDEHGRKNSMMLPIIGSGLACSLFGASLSPGYTPIPFQVCFILAGALLYGLCGKSSAISMGAHSYITDCSTHSKRTTLIGRLLGANFVGLSLGTALVAIFHHYFNSFQWVLLFVVLANACILAVLVLFVKDSLVVAGEGDIEAACVATGNLAAESHEEAGKVKICSNCVASAITPFRESYKYLIRDRPESRHIYLRLLLAAVLFNQLTKAGEEDSLLLFLQRQEVGWSDSLYGAYLTTVNITMAFNLIIVFPIMDKILKPSDTTLVIVGLVTKAVRLIGTALSPNTVLIFAFAVLGSPSGYVICSLRSMITKLVGSGEIGTSFALMSFLETLANLAGSSLFTSSYAATVSSFPGTIFLIDAALQIASCAGIFWVHQKLKRLPDPDFSIEFQ